MNEAEKKKLVQLAVKKCFVPWAYPETDEQLIVLDSEFKNAISRFKTNLAEQVSSFEDYFSGMEEAALKAAAGRSKSENCVPFEEDLGTLRKVAINAIGPHNEYFLAAIGGKPAMVADFRMWSLRDRFDGYELALLSMGLEPRADLIRQLKEFVDGYGGLDPFVGQIAAVRLDIINRSSALEIWGHSRATGIAAFNWFNSIELAAPQGFQEMLTSANNRLLGNDLSKKEDASGTVSSPDPRAIRTVSKLVAAMAIDGYGWDPKNNRSPIPGQLEAECDKLGLSVSRETILKYLRIGIKQRDDPTS